MHVQKKLLFTSFAVGFHWVIGCQLTHLKVIPQVRTWDQNPPQWQGAMHQCSHGIDILSWESKGTPPKPPPQKKIAGLSLGCFFYHWFGPYLIRPFYSHDVLFKNFKHQIMQKINEEI